MNEERDAANQIFFGAMDTRYCVLLSLAVHLEFWLGTSQGSTPANTFLLGVLGEHKEKGLERMKTTIYNTLKNKVFKSDDFQSAQSGSLGLYSF